MGRDDLTAKQREIYDLIAAAGGPVSIRQLEQEYERDREAHQPRASYDEIRGHAEAIEAHGLVEQLDRDGDAVYQPVRVEEDAG